MNFWLSLSSLSCPKAPLGSMLGVDVLTCNAELGGEDFFLVPLYSNGCTAVTPEKILSLMKNKVNCKVGIGMDSTFHNMFKRSRKQMKAIGDRGNCQNRMV